MTCITPAGTSDPLSPTMLSTASGRPPIPREQRRHLDRQRLNTGVVARQKRLAAIETEMVAACEQAAARGAAASVRIDDRETGTVRPGIATSPPLPSSNLTMGRGCGAFTKKSTS